MPFSERSETCLASYLIGEPKEMITSPPLGVTPLLPVLSRHYTSQEHKHGAVFNLGREGLNIL